MRLHLPQIDPAAADALGFWRGPWGPPADRAAWPKASPADRVLAATVALLAGTLLAIAAWLSPDPRGHGTHCQLALPPCSSEAFTGRPCPTCGMTTAFAYFVHGEPLAAVRAQLLGAVLAAVALLGAIGGTVMAVTGVDFGPVLRRMFVERAHWVWALIVLGVGSWGLKVYIG